MMGIKILNESYVFSCSAAETFPVPFIQAKDTQSKGYDTDGKVILTETAKCMLNGASLCKNNPHPTSGAPQPCTLGGHFPWQKTNGTMTIDGKETLTEESTCECASFRGEISPKDPLPTTKIEKGASADEVADIATIVTTDSTAKASKVSDSTAQKKDAPPIAPPVIPTQGGADSELKAVETSQETTGVQEVEKKEIPDKEYMLCDYKNCENATSCDYYKAKLAVVSKPSELKNYYKAEFPHEQKAYETKEAEVKARLSDNGFTNAGHHLVSVNQCFLREKDNKLRVGKLVRLAVFFGYDINNALNCILLPTSNIHSTKTENNELRTSAFDIMSEMKAQWHVGGHSYPISDETKNHIKKYFDTYPQIGVSIAGDTLISNYADLVIGELEKLQARKYKQKRCQMVDKEMKAEAFSELMNQISQNIKEKLDLFQENSKKSYPYYVSSVALSFAFDIPATLKLMVITHTAKGINGEIYRIKRLAKNDRAIHLTPVGCHLVEPTSSFVKFCSNVTFFLDLERQPLELGFYPSQGFKSSDLFVYPLTLSKHWDNSTSISTYLQENCHELLAEMSKYENAYQGASSVQSIRQKALKEGERDT